MFSALLVQAYRALARHKTRAALNVLGIAVGIAAVIWVVALTQEGTARAEEQLHALGDNLVWVEAGSRNVNGVHTGVDGSGTLTLEDAAAIEREIPAIKRVSPNVDGSVVVQWQAHTWTTRYRGVSPDYEDIKRWEIGEGARFTDEDVDRAANVCLLGETVAEHLFGDTERIGQLIRINGRPFTVVGVLAPKGQSSTGRDQDDEIHIPYSTAMKKLRGGRQMWLDDVLCSATSPTTIHQATSAILSLMRQRHHIGLEASDDFNIRHPEELVEAQMRTSEALQTLLFCVASVALLVGGIGLMNVMLASVVERTREIGVRLAVGAPPRAIRWQFLIESVLLSSLGGAVGIVLSIYGVSLMSRMLKWSLTTSPTAVLVSVVFSVTTGVVFGYMPARRASKVDPIAALRRE